MPNFYYNFFYKLNDNIHERKVWASSEFFALKLFYDLMENDDITNVVPYKVESNDPTLVKTIKYPMPTKWTKEYEM